MSYFLIINKSLIVYFDLFKRANGEYVYFLEDDDYISEDFFEIFSQYNQDIMYFNYKPYLPFKAL